MCSLDEMQVQQIITVEGTMLPDIGQCLVQGKKASMTMSLTNNGILPAVARIMMEPHPCFCLAPGPQLVTLASKQSHRLNIDFDALEVKQHAHEVGAAAVFASIQAVCMGDCVHMALQHNI